MQNKGLINFLTWAFALVCLFQLSFSFVTRNVESKAKKAAAEYVASPAVQQQIAKMTSDKRLELQVIDSIRTASESAYLDSMATEKVWFGYTYRQCQSRELGLGLDLKGGMNVMLEVSTVDVVRALANHTSDPAFNTAIDNALAKQKVTTNRDFVTLFYDEFKAIAPDAQLSALFGSQLKDRIKLSDDNDAVIKVVREEASSAYDRTYEILRQRIDKFGVAQPSIQQLRASERILVELPGVKEPERVRKLLQGTAQLEFWLTYEASEALRMIDNVDKFIASANVAVSDGVDAEVDSLDALAAKPMSEASSASADAAKEHPFYARFSPNIDPATGQFGRGPVVGYAMGKDREILNNMLQTAAEKKIYDKRRVKFLWSAKPMQEGSDVYQLFAIKVSTRQGEALLDGGVITDARQDFSQVGGNEISMTMNNEGAREWKRITGENVGKCIAIVLDDL
ncbi:MAG: protein translocase subunit SecDF, partial [Bacteroidales bacterium]|nr:protein translocase subunit SecDF [Bacteroidales bacterium]